MLTCCTFHQLMVLHADLFLVLHSCGTMLVAQGGKFEALGSGYVRDETGAQQEFTRAGDSGVIDVDAIDVDD